MNESRARYITLVGVALMGLLFFYFYVFEFSGISAFNVQGSFLYPDVYPILFAMLAVGVLIILSAFSKICFYIFIVSDTVLLPVLLSRGYGLDSDSLLCLLLFVPIVFYYTVRLVLRRRLKKQNK